MSRRLTRQKRASSQQPCADACRSPSRRGQIWEGAGGGDTWWNARSLWGSSRGLPSVLFLWFLYDSQHPRMCFSLARGWHQPIILQSISWNLFFLGKKIPWPLGGRPLDARPTFQPQPVSCVNWQKPSSSDRLYSDVSPEQWRSGTGISFTMKWELKLRLGGWRLGVSTHNASTTIN
jgi:hypothetical protein